MNPFAEIQIVRGDKLFTLHWKYRFDPVTLAVVATAYTAYAGYQEGKSEQALNEYNAKLSEREAESIEAKTKFDQKRQAEAAARGLSTMQAAVGKAGAVTTTGSPLLAQATQAAEYELENLMIGREGSIAAGRARSQAGIDKMQAKMAGQRAKSSLIGGGLSAGSTLLTGYKTPADKDAALWAKHQKNAGIYD